MVFRLVAAIFVAIWLLPAAACAQAGQYGLVNITSPTSGQDLSGSRTVEISWESLLGDGVDYAITCSTDGEAFDREIASKLTACQMQWTPEDRFPLLIWIKVKAFRDGYLLDQATVQVSFIPRDSVVVSRGDQRVFHFSNGKLHDVFTCSTALPQYDLKEGRYRVYVRERKHWSREWEVWMPHSLFFYNGYALHATTMIHQLGRPASHGCVRLHPRDAEKLYGEVSVGTPVIVLPKSQRCATLLSLIAEEKPALSASCR